ncbi:unnamed protein product [Oreochromis niloticus]|nr:unnamed protein product [Mustela putorius furo]
MLAPVALPNQRLAPTKTERTYTLCKEMCREMATSIMGKIDERFDTFEARFQSLLSEQKEMKNGMESQEQATCALDERVEALEAKCSDLTQHANQLKTKLQDLEARSRRHDIKIVDIPEDEEKGMPTDFVSRLIPELLGKEHFPHPIKVDRAHRALQAKPTAGAKPRTILARIHHFQEKELILRRCRMQKGCEYKGNKVMIFPDYTNEVMNQHCAFNGVMQTLRSDGIKHTLRNPARLYVYWHDGQAPSIFNDADEAARCIKGHGSTMRN